jgi:sigma-B regulation protein RsbU (phosphoserine phosphatase)
MTDDAGEFASSELVDALPCGVLITDIAGTIVRTNRTFCVWVGLEPGDIVGKKKLQDFFTMGGRIFHQTHWTPALQMQGSLAEVKFEVKRSDGVTVPMMLNAVRRRHGGQSVNVVSLTVAEERNKYERELVAARKRADLLLEKERAAQLLLADRALFAEQMVGIVSHDLRNPLSAILAGASLLDQGDSVPREKRDKLVKTVMSSARSARRLIEDLLDFTLARVGSGLTVERRPCEFHALVARTVENLVLAFPGRTLAHDSLGHGAVSADGDRVAQLLGNLVGNAMAYGDAATPVTVTSEVSEHTVRVSVHNVGAPIPAGTLDGMFEPMVRGHPTEGSSRSVGLGLFIVRAIAQAHGGAVSVVSEQEKGTTFTFAFPPT